MKLSYLVANGYNWCLVLILFKAILGDSLNLPEAGEVIESYKLILGSLYRVSVAFIQESTSKVV